MYRILGGYRFSCAAYLFASRGYLWILRHIASDFLFPLLLISFPCKIYSRRRYSKPLCEGHGLGKAWHEMIARAQHFIL